ncbi:MAG: ATP-dependent DNA ligase [Actinobacteria bacterium]|nr:ATP-dependent DNA ligase [Actinomycetota bacterium]
MQWSVVPPIDTMEAKTKTSLPLGPGWAYEPKWDGFRCVAYGGDLRLDSRAKKPLLRYFPELVAVLEQLPSDAVVDGEVVIITDDHLDFVALQQRIHPAESRINKLSAETPAQLVAFDLIALDGVDMRERPFSERRVRLERLLSTLGEGWNLTPSTTDFDTGLKWFDEFEAAGCDGIVAKELDAAYQGGKRAMVKVKHRRSVDVVVGGYRIHKDGDKVGSLLLGLYNNADELHFIGHCSGFSNHDRTEMLARFEELRSEESFGSERMPGAESRWSGGKDMSWVPVRPGVVVEISYDQLTGNAFRHATRFERWRPDKTPEMCTMDQLERPTGPGIETVIGSP